ncbi:MAG TPA: nuclear transport factor 2 family protein [Steroidobacteraceae bacterium]|nr:nuclear transport factor 2 family protein [Steroidobacteraceae bacterium]
MVQATTDSEKIVLEFFRTLSSGDLERVREQLHEHATWTPQVKDIPGAGVHRGRKGIVDDFLAPVRGLFEPGEPKVEIDNIVSRGNLVALETRGIGRLKNGKNYHNLYSWWIEVRDGKIFAIREYMDSHYVATLVG